MTTILLTGATGNVVSSVLRELHGSGHKLVGLVRDPAKAQALAAQGIELRSADLSDLRSVEDAFSGIDVAFLLAPPGSLAPAQMSNALWGARKGGVKHVVRMSAVGAAHDAPTINSRFHALSDTELERSGIPFTVVKPHFFMQNLMMAAETIAAQGTIYLALGDAALPMVDVRDIGSTVAAILKNPASHAGKTYTLTGRAAVTLQQVASAIGEAIGKPVRYVPVPVPAMVEQLAKFGMDDYGQTAMRDYLVAYSAGWQASVTSAVKDITGSSARSIQQFATDFAGAFGKS
jgi:uncharacterized protein YbjT (DUF2867 family)